MKKKFIYLIVILLIISSLAAFGRIHGNDFINLDDDKYITANNNIKSGMNLQNIKLIFSAVVDSNWHPLTLISHTLDWSLFGENASGHHIVSLLLHIGAVLFLFFFLNKTTNNLLPAAFAAALFALHPLRVESVAWASERKDVLSMFFGMAALYSYAFYAENSRLSRYFLCLLLFALSLMSKPMLVTLPFVLLLLDYWPLSRWTKDISATLQSRGHVVGRIVWEKIPFIFLTIASSITTFWAQNKAVVVSLEYLSLSKRIANAIISYVSYLGKIFWPVDLAIFYPYEYPFPLWQILTSCFILIGITIVVIYAIKKLPFLFVGWFWYLGTLIPVIGFVQIGRQAMADRYTYLPSIGITIMLVWGFSLLFPREDIRKRVLFPAAIAVITIMAVLTWKQCGYWKNSITLFSHALQVTKDNSLAHNNLGVALYTEGKIEEAFDHFNEVLRITQGNTYTAAGQHQRSIENLNNAIPLISNYALACNNRGVIYGKLHQYQRAIEDFNEAIRLKQDYPDAYNNRAMAYLSQGNKKLGCRDAQKACELGNCKMLERAKGKGLCR